MNGLKLGWKSYETMMNTIWSKKPANDSTTEKAKTIALKFVVFCFPAILGLPAMCKWSFQRLTGSSPSVKDSKGTDEKTQAASLDALKPNRTLPRISSNLSDHTSQGSTSSEEEDKPAENFSLKRMTPLSKKDQTLVNDFNTELKSLIPGYLRNPPLNTSAKRLVLDIMQDKTIQPKDHKEILSQLLNKDSAFMKLPHDKRNDIVRLIIETGSPLSIDEYDTFKNIATTLEEPALNTLIETLKDKSFPPPKTEDPSVEELIKKLPKDTKKKQQLYASLLSDMKNTGVDISENAATAFVLEGILTKDNYKEFLSALLNEKNSSNPEMRGAFSSVFTIHASFPDSLSKKELEGLKEKASTIETTLSSKESKTNRSLDRDSITKTIQRVIDLYHPGLPS